MGYRKNPYQDASHCHMKKEKLVKLVYITFFCCSGTKVVVAAGIPSAVVTPGAFRYKTCELVGRVMTVESAGIHKLPVSPAASD